jgi:BolA family transcriptional regulator, general stress-responsive regulator
MSISESIVSKLAAGLDPSHLEVVNESHRHNVPPGSESHFKVVVVSEAFRDLSPVACHRAVYRLLGEELGGPVHALALHTYAPEDWAALGAAPDSPLCRGGAARERT